VGSVEVTVPAEDVQVRRKSVSRVKAPRSNLVPGFGGEDLGVQFTIPEHLEFLPLSVVIHTGKADQGRVSGVQRWDGLFD
jgi:hypothetical protein